MKVSLILEGGGMRGVFTAGVLDCFLDNQIQFNHCIGVSAGATTACSYLSKQKGRNLHIFTEYLDDKRYCSMHSLLTTGNLFGVDFIYHKIPEEIYPIDNDAFKSNTCTLEVVVTNCMTAEAEYLKVNDLILDVDSILASSSLPALSKMVKIQSNLYLDGGIADSIPIKESIRQGYDKHVVILTREKGYSKSPSKLTKVIGYKYRKFPALVKKLERRHEEYNETIQYLFEEEKKGNIFIISPKQSLGLSRLEKNKEKLLEAYNEGYNVAEECLVALKKFIQN